MRTSLDCIPCFIRQALEVVRFVTEDTKLHERIVKDTLLAVSNLDLTQSPPAAQWKMPRRSRWSATWISLSTLFRTQGEYSIWQTMPVRSRWTNC
jgi:hypothetical protein